MITGSFKTKMVRNVILNNCETRENFKFKFFKKKGGKTVIYRNSPEKSWEFYRSWMTKRIAPLESSREI